MATAAGASASVAAATSPSGDDCINSGAAPFLPLGVTFGPATEPGPLDKTGRLPNELLESMFDFLDEDQTMNCASVARRCVHEKGRVRDVWVWWRYVNYIGSDLHARKLLA